MKSYFRSWWITFRYGSVFTKAGRELRRIDRSPMSDFVEVGRPGGS